MYNIHQCLVCDCECVSIPTDHTGHHHALQGSYPLGVELIDVVAKSQLTIAIISPAIHLAIL